MKMFHRVMTEKPAWGDGHYSYAQLLQKTGDLPGALQEFKIAVDLSPLSSPAHRWYGEALLEDGQVDLAVVQLKEAVNLDGSADAMHDLIRIYLRQGQTTLAEPLLRRIAAKFPYDSAAHFSLGKILADAGKKTEAKSEYEAGLSSDPGNVEARAALKKLN
jgi:tetratricopeptide (TPR) repeat protein